MSMSNNFGLRFVGLFLLSLLGYFIFTLTPLFIELVGQLLQALGQPVR